MPNTQSYALNHLLAALPPEDYSRVSPHLTFGPLRGRQILQRRSEALREIFFPGRSLCSLILSMSEGTGAEIVVVGSEGLIGVEAALGLRIAMCDATVQVAGDGVGHSMSIDFFQAELERRGALHDIVRKFTQAFMGFVMQSAACNGLHSVEARCCRWLLNAQDRLGCDEFPVTHGLLAAMLGVRRPTVTLIMTNLTQLGIISTSRGAIRITGRDTLEARSCGCYKTVKTLFDELLPSPVDEDDHSYQDAI